MPRGGVRGGMVWLGLLRVVDFPRLLEAQPVVATALERAAGSAEARTIREGFALLGKVRMTGRAGLVDVHDLAWLDHTVVGPGDGNGLTWDGEDARRGWADLADRGRPDHPVRELLPRRGDSEWVDLGVAGVGGSRIRAERGAAGPYVVGLVPHDRIRALGTTLGLGGARRFTPEIGPVMYAAERATAPGTFLVFAGSSLE